MAVMRVDAQIKLENVSREHVNVQSLGIAPQTLMFLVAKVFSLAKIKYFDRFGASS